jgi:myosin heavy subunit
MSRHVLLPQVFYDHRGFLEKNNDNLAEDVVMLLQNASNPMLEVRVH